MAFLEAAKRNVDLIVASEPNKNLIQNNPKWMGENLGDVAIWARTNNARFSKVTRGDGFIALFGEEYTIIAGYISPNCTMERFDRYLNDLQQVATGQHGELILIGDFNANSSDWGASIEDARGGALSQMVGALEMVALNTGEPTFVRRNQKTCIDVTFGSLGLVNHSTDWQILENEPCSPHKHICFEIGSITARKNRLSGCYKPNKQKFVQAVGNLLERRPEVNGGKEISKLMKNASRAACAENRSTATGQSNPYWWTEQVEQMRKNCIEVRCRALRVRGNPNVVDVEKEASWQRYKDAKKSLHKEISSRKKASWTELCTRLDKDIWGDGYKIVMRQLKPGNPVELTEKGN
ncbi:uncharacterized protein [Euwallacea similis]|uniref:uncharacterized protein n=1 Tax=Euwallacea similis TaxID=1736056 RepID=UPI00344C12EC